MGRKACLALAALLLALAAPLAAQETQVPLDEAGRVRTVDLALARQLGLWVDEHPDFHEARLFRGADGGFVLEITTLSAGEVERFRFPLGAAEAAALRRDVGARLAARAPAPEELDQRGRYLLLGQTTTAGLLFYGWALPYALDMDGGAAAGTYLLTAAGSFFLPFALTQGRPVSYGMANLSRYGVTRGIAHGALLHVVVAGEEEDRQFSCVPERPEPCLDTGDGDDFERARLAVSLLGSVAEGVGGYLWARNERMTAGTANAIGLGGDAGLLFGMGTAYLLGADDGPSRFAAALAVPGAVAGVVAGHRIAARRDYVWGDVDVMFNAGLLGAFTGLALVDAVSENQQEALSAAAMLGGAAGLYLSDRLVRDTDFTVGQATMNRLGTLAGALAGGSIGVLLDDEELSMVTGALGGIAGFYGTYAALAPAARRQSGEAISSLEVRLAPDLLGRRALLTAAYRF